MFEDRLGSRGLSRFYALFQVFVVCALLGFGNFVAYKIASSIATKPEAQWTEADRAAVSGYGELKQLEKLVADTTLPAELKPRLDTLRDRHARGELHSYITVLPSLPFYIIFAVVVGAYMILGGMAAAALNEALQGILIIVFSVMLIPAGLSAIGGWDKLSERVPREMFNLFDGDGGSPLFIFAVLFASLVQIHGLSHNMGIYGSAKNEFAARFGGVTGAYMKRVMIVLWAFAGIIAVAVFGVGGLADPDAAWGVMTNRLLGPGFIGLMLAGVLAGTMSTLAAKALAISSLFVRNFWRHIRPDTTEQQSVRAARWTIFSVLVLGVVSAEAMDDVETLVKLVLTVNIPFGAAVILMFFWRRLTVPAVWASVALSAFSILIAPFGATHVDAVASHPTLTQTVPNAVGKPVPVYFKQVVRLDANDPESELVGRGRFNFECYALSWLGLAPEKLTPSGRETAQFLFDGFFPFVVLILVSLFTRPPGKERLDQFFGKMKTPIGATPELEEQAMVETRQHPDRFDHTKILGAKSSWEFARWDRVDTIGFLGCCATSGAIIAAFVLLLRWAAA
jgi:SSS family solute:Na+ symporter